MALEQLEETGLWHPLPCMLLLPVVSPVLHVDGHVNNCVLLCVYPYTALFVHLGVVEQVWTFLCCSEAQLLPRWWLCVFCIQTNLSVWKTRCTVQHSTLLLSEYRGAFTSTMQTEERTWNCALSAFRLQTGYWGCSQVFLGASRGALLSSASAMG